MSGTYREALRKAFAMAPQGAKARPQPLLVAFEEDLHWWAMQRCVFRDRCWGGVAGLHLDYVKWCEQTMDVPCSRAQFREWLVANGFFLNEGGLVYGLILGVDDEYRKSTFHSDPHPG
jgi:hypothetical protein